MELLKDPIVQDFAVQLVSFFRGYLATLLILHSWIFCSPICVTPLLMSCFGRLWCLAASGSSFSRPITCGEPVLPTICFLIVSLLCTAKCVYVCVCVCLCVCMCVCARVRARMCVVVILYCHDGPWPIRHNEL